MGSAPTRGNRATRVANRAAGGGFREPPGSQVAVEIYGNRRPRARPLPTPANNSNAPPASHGLLVSTRRTS
ncbi:hypothetical protein GCM10009608_35860 [Pseudonocardia alaniniphila]